MTNKTIVYKYCKIPESQHWEAMLSKVKFTKLAFLNDPFEGFLKVRDDLGNVVDKISDDFFVASFSLVSPYTKENKLKANDHIESNIYMWSHYADSLNGICIEYEIIDNCNKKIQGEQVTYVTKHQKKISPFIKYKSWEFEKEYRFSFLCKNKEKSELFKDNPKVGLKIRNIFIGVRLLGKDKRHKVSSLNRKMRELPFVIYLHQKYPQIPLYICARHRNSFKIIKKSKEIWDK